MNELFFLKQRENLLDHSGNVPAKSWNWIKTRAENSRSRTLK
jgi:hypothetical protein